MNFQLLKTCILAILLMSFNIHCATTHDYEISIKNHTEHWTKNKIEFKSIVPLLSVYDRGDIQEILVTRNGNNSLVIETRPNVSSIDSQDLLISQLKKTEIYMVKFHSDRVALFGKSTTLGDDFLTAISVNSVYLYLKDSQYIINQNEICNDSLYTSKGSIRCYLKLDEKWIVEHTILIPN